ncbi:MAG: BatA domain-containing protein [Akkermansiaceae bacterium]
MTFLSPLLLWFLAAASVPVIIHLLNKRRHKTLQWAAMQFLLKATRESRGKKKLRHILILTCRTLGLAALACAAARPIVSGLLGWGAGTIDTVVLILDRSASMELRSGDGEDAKRELVLRKIREAMSNIGSPRLVVIDSASGKPQEIPSPDVLGQISATAATDSTANVPTLLASAADVLTKSTGRSEIWLASDLQRSNWRPDDDRWAALRANLQSLPEKPAIRILSISGDSAANTSLRLLNTRRTIDGLILNLELNRSKDNRGSIGLPVTTQINGASQNELITLPGQSLRFQKRIPIKLEDESGHGWLSIPADGNPRDNSVFFAYGPARPIKSIIVSESNEAANYLSLAAAPPNFEKQTVTRIEPGAFAATSTSELSLILWAAPLPTGESAKTLQNFLSSGGQVVLLPSPKSAATEAFLETQWEPISTSASGKFFILKDWERADGPLRDGVDGSPIPAERLRAIKRAIPKSDAAVLAKWEDGEPFITRKIVDKGTLWTIGSIPDYTWSNLGDADVLLPAVQRILALGAERFDASFLAEVGSDSAMLAPSETRTRVDDYSKENSDHVAGVFRLGNRLTAVNRPLAEDELETTTKDSLDAMLEGTDYRLLDQAGQTSDPSLSTHIWRAFLVAMLFFLISEALLCMPKENSVTTTTPQHGGAPSAT